jgi:hypothetical protein
LRFPQCVLAIRIEHPHYVTVQCPHDDARHHGRPIEIDDQEQGFYDGLPDPCARLSRTLP